MKSYLRNFTITVILICIIILPVQAGNAYRNSNSGRNTISSTASDTANFFIPFVVDINHFYSFGVCFGVNPNATKGFDASLGEVEYPPKAPGGGMALLNNGEGNAILDLRPYISGAQIDTYRICMPFYEDESYLFPVTFSWPDLNSYYSGSVHLKSGFFGDLFDVDMKAQTSYTLTSSTYPLNPGFSQLNIYIIAEAPLAGNSSPIVSTFGIGAGAFQAILNGSAPLGNVGKTATSVNVWFEYGPTLSYGSSTAPQSVPSGSMTNVSSTFDINSIPNDSRYHVRAVAQSGIGTFYGGDRLISRGSPPAYTGGDTTRFRTATYFDWATAKDQKEKRKSVKAKPDKIIVKFNLVAPGNATGLKLKFNMQISGTLSSGTSKTITLLTLPQNGLTELDYNGSISLGDTLQFDGIGYKGKNMKVGYEWATSPRATKGKIDGSTFQTHSLRLPMPNLHNVGEGIYGGVMQTPMVITVGTNSDTKGSHTAYHPKYKDVVKSLVKEQKSGDLYHTNPPRCIDVFDKNSHFIDKAQKGLPPDKHNNILFAEQLILKLNLLASDSGMFPQGFGDLVFDNSGTAATPFDGETIRLIAAQTDSFLGCFEPPALDADSADFLSALQLINGSFSAPFDTQSWSGEKVICTGTNIMDDVPFLHAGAFPVPKIIFNPGYNSLLSFQPEAFQLSQNYPNPFNPTTTIEFILPSTSIVTLKVYNMLGQEVAVLLNGEMLDEGDQSIAFNASNLSSGVYIYRIEAQAVSNDEDDISAGKFIGVKKMMLIK